MDEPRHKYCSDKVKQTMDENVDGSENLNVMYQCSLIEAIVS